VRCSSTSSLLDALPLCGLLLVLSASSAQGAEVHLASVPSGCFIVKLFERCEVTVKVEGDIRNPYDPDEVTLEATFRPFRGDPVTVQGFYYQPFKRRVEGTREVIQTAGSPVWKIRFTPRRLGLWSYEVRLITPKGRQSLPPKPFVVVPSWHRGFVQLNRQTGSFVFDSGAPFIPVGENLCWGPSVQPLLAYDQWFRDLARRHANYIRVWMAPWSFRLETTETGVGRYDQLRAWQLDYLLERSEQRGLYWQLCLLNHGSFSRTQDPDWDHNPYNEELGGMCRLPNDFLTDPRAKAMCQRLLRYLVSRWGSSPQLTMWELFNEADYGEFRTEDLTGWIDEMSRFLRTIDVNQRPITTSFHQQSPAEVWRLPTIDVIQLHLYDQRDFAEALGGPMIATLKQTFGKPVFIGEFGWTEDVVRKIDDLGIHLHEGLWSSLMGGAYGGALVWFWDSYVHPRGLERHFLAMESFWRGERVEQQTKRVEVSLSDRRLAGWGIGNSERVHLWIRNRAHNLGEYCVYRCELAKARLARARGQPVTLVTYAPRPVRGATVTVRGLDQEGRYRVEWWDTYRGRVMVRSATRVQQGTLTLEVPAVRFDVAAKLTRLQWWELGGALP